MTDREKLLELLLDFGITPRTLSGLTNKSVTLEVPHGGVEGDEHSWCQFVFDQDGKFLKVGVWSA